AQQYDMNLRPAAARSCEPTSLLPMETITNIYNLQTYFKITGVKKYLRGIPSAIEWLEKSVLPPDKTIGSHTHAMFYEIGTNRPLFVHREGTSYENGRYWIDYEPTNLIEGYGTHVTINVDYLWNEYKRIEAMTPEEAMAEYRKSKESLAAVPTVASGVVEACIRSLDERGAWVEDFVLPDFTNYMNGPKRTVRGIVTGTYIRNMNRIMDYIRTLDKTE
ncbi:MAG: hypothetical protein ABIH23_31245, partial [bacterium]